VPSSGNPIVFCVDGSDASTRAVAAGLAIVHDASPVIFVTVVEETDPTLVTGGGLGGGVMTREESETLDSHTESEGRAVAEAAAAATGVANAEVRVVRGDPGRALCALASELPARALVIGSRGRGGIKRALLGSVSDYVVRNAPCPVVITGPGD
jgi:nucleotide-binding universal stress UspA family protein